jgi:hypothetical protein
MRTLLQGATPVADQSGLRNEVATDVMVAAGSRG